MMRRSTSAKSRVRRRRLFAEPLEERRLLAATELAELFPAMRPDYRPDVAVHARSWEDGQQHGEGRHFHCIDGKLFEAAALPQAAAAANAIEDETLPQAAAALHPLSSIPALNSLPGAAATLYLDFNGHFEAEWGAYSNITTPAYDADGDASTFSDAELSFIQNVWADVAEDYAPFNINVTTVEPPELASGVPASAADGRALRVAIGGDGAWYGGGGGVAYINSFTNYIPNVAFVFASGASGAIWTASASSHEAGHAFGLRHQNGVQDFVARHTAIMSSLVVPQLVDSITWHSGVNGEGEYQDDMAVIAGPTNGFGYRADDHGNTLATATPLTASGSGFVASGIIGTNDDIDVFSITSSTPGSFLFTLDGHSPGQNLNAVLELRDSTGAVLLTADPGDSLDASLIGGVTGTSYIAVRSNGQYGRIGQYSLNVTPTAPGVRVITSGAPLTTSESGRSETIALALDARPAADVTLQLASSDPQEGSLSTNQVTFTPDNWFIPQPVVITGQTDDAGDGAAGYTVTISAAESADPAYGGVFDPQDLQLVNLDEAAGRLYWLAENPGNIAQVKSATLTGENVQTVVDILGTFTPTGASFSPESIAVDPLRGHIYWTDRTDHSIFRTNHDGSAPARILSDLGGPDGLAIDAAAGKLYWISKSRDVIQRANLDGSGVETLVSEGLGFADQLILDASAGKMYWNDTQLRTISRANLDGSDVEAVVIADSPVNAFTVDAAAGKVYFALTASSSKTIHRANLDGTNQELVLDASSIVPGTDGNMRSMSIDADAGRLYWTTLGGGLFSANLDGSLVATIAQESGARMAGLAILPPTPGVTVSPRTELVTTEAGGAATFSVVLDSQPTADVTIPVVSSDATEGSVSASSLVFTSANWKVPQIVTITGVDELLNDGDVAYTIELGPAASADAEYAGLDVADMSVTNLDNDAPLFADSFEEGEWNGLWVEDSQNDWFRSTQRRTDGVRSAEVDGRASDATLTMAAGVDLTPYASAELSFSWYIESGFDRNEYLAVDVFNGSWREVARLRGNDDQENAWHHETIEITGADLTSDFKIRFRASVSSSTEDANVDDVRLIATSLAGPPNQLPTAIVGGPYTGIEGSAVALSAAGSSDADGTIVSYEWDFDNDGQYDDASGTSPVFVSTADGTHPVHLRVTDDRGGTATASTSVTLANVAPVASAGGAYAGSEGGAILLSAAGSTDPGDDVASYAWDFDGDSQYDDATGVNPSFLTNEDGVYTVGVRVTDHRGAASTDSAVVTVANVAPTASAGGPYADLVGEQVLLSAAGSNDPGDDIASYAWDLDGDGQYDDAAGASAAFQSPTPGNYEVSVRVSDDDGAISTASTVIAITEVPAETTVFTDSFEQGQWGGRWAENSQNDWFTSTQRETDGRYSAEVDGRATNATLTLAQPIDLSGYASAELKFDWLIESGFDRGEFVALDVFNGSSWINDVRRLSGNQSAENTWHGETVDLSPWMSASTRIRFRAYVSSSSEDANVDNVRIVASGAAPAALAMMAASLDEAIALSLDGAPGSPGQTTDLAARETALESIGRDRSKAPAAQSLWRDRQGDFWASLSQLRWTSPSELAHDQSGSTLEASDVEATLEAFNSLGDASGFFRWQ